MNTKFTLALLFMCALSFSTSAQQIPNAGFETWTSPNNPDNWGTWESAFGLPMGLATKDTVSKVEGNASIRLKTDSIQAGPQKRLIAGLVSLGSAVYGPPLNLYGIPFSGRPDTLFFSYKYAPAGNDTAYVEMEVSGTTGTLFIGGFALSSTNNQWVNVFAPLTADINPGTVDSIRILFASSLLSGTGVQGSVLNVDAIRFGYVSIPSGIGAVASEANGISVFPNPASDVLNITAEESIENGVITVMDVAGKLVSESLMTGTHTAINVSQFQTGVYIYRVNDKSGTTLKQGRFTVGK